MSPLNREQKNLIGKPCQQSFSMTKKAKAKMKKPNGAYQFVPEQSITLMLFEKNLHGAFLDASSIQTTGTGLQTCQDMCEKGTTTVPMLQNLSQSVAPRSHIQLLFDQA